MALYDVGDLILSGYDTAGRLVCDGSAVSDTAYPELRSAIINAVPQTIEGQTPPPGYFFLPNIPDNPHYPNLPVLIQAEEA
ncbi:hypothetical protein LOS15_07405 [Halomonas sp. 7T]|uniref:hypothetical protein n=1 Tax=Halomonas sp. 7T TaxID=2893469 RepID=UPI0021D8F3AD|nr:hypothetical protein [Halomonas sp. 7T]UXZ55837.1 hypothetical protein LOS15_07405 [Halomonas sp. 7T]